MAGRTLLLTGFGPFLRFKYNPSGAIAKNLNGATIEGCKIAGVVLPVKLYSSAKALRSAINVYKPFAVISLGMSAVLGCVALERIAINRFYYTPGKLIDMPIRKAGPVAYFSTLPLASIKRRLGRIGVPAEYSFWPDTFVSNAVFYELMNVAKERKLRYAGFIHLPQIHRQVIENNDAHYMLKQRMPSLSYDEEENAVRAAIGACLR